MEKKTRKNTADRVEEIIRRPVEEAGYVLWDVDYYKEGTDHNLLVTIERPGGGAPIGLEDCEKVTRLIDPILDEADPIEESYYLEVSSPGLERELKRREHFEAFLGSRVRAKLFHSPDGKKTIEGVLKAYEGGRVTLLDGENETVLEKEAYSKITLLDGETE